MGRAVGSQSVSTWDFSTVEKKQPPVWLPFVQSSILASLFPSLFLHTSIHLLIRLAIHPYGRPAILSLSVTHAHTIRCTCWSWCLCRRTFVSLSADVLLRWQTLCNQVSHSDGSQKPWGLLEQSSLLPNLAYFYHRTHQMERFLDVLDLFHISIW